MNAKHTPGDWHLEPDDKRQNVYSAAGVYIGEVLDDDDDTGECLANARLVAAAPELLGALLALVESASADFADELRWKAWEVIHKARGRP